MANRDVVLRYLQSIYPGEATNSDIVSATKIEPHQQVFQITSYLRKNKKIRGRQIGREWFFTFNPDAPAKQERVRKPTRTQTKKSSPARFEQLARERFSRRFGVELTVGELTDVPKIWDMISPDGEIVGDAKYYTLVGGVSKPPAKFSVIAEHVWLLENTSAEIKFLVFGNQIEVPKLWLEKYGSLVKSVRFYFMDDSGKITTLN